MNNGAIRSLPNKSEKIFLTSYIDKKVGILIQFFSFFFVIEYFSGSRFVYRLVQSKFRFFL